MQSTGHLIAVLLLWLFKRNGLPYVFKKSHEPGTVPLLKSYSQPVMYVAAGDKHIAALDAGGKVSIAEGEEELGHLH